jgi:tRNA pseudouridine13 synthase
MIEVAYCTMTMPFLTAILPGIGGQMRAFPEDFQVEEHPLYLPCGEGEHLYVKIKKRLLSTPDLVLRLSSVLGVKAQAIGVAGLKDARAVTTQMVSLLGVTPELLDRLKLDEQLLSVEVLGRHRNRLRPGHHAGNHFRLVIRDVATHACETAPLVTDMLTTRRAELFRPTTARAERQNYQIGAELLVTLVAETG